MLYIYILLYYIYNILYIHHKPCHLTGTPLAISGLDGASEPRFFRPRFAVIENEFGAVPIDNELLADSVPILQGLGSVGIVGIGMGWARCF